MTFIELTPTQQIEQRLKDLSSQDIMQRTFFENKWRLFKEHLEAKGMLADTSIQSKLKVVASFFARNSLKLNLRRGDWQSNQEQDVNVRKWVLSNEELRRMYGHANLRDRAMLLVLYQSGLSQTDVCSMKIEHLTGLIDNPVTEHYYFEKNRNNSIVFTATCLSFEALHDIKAMLQERQATEGYLFTSQTKGKGEQLKSRTINDAMISLAIRTFGEKKVKEKQFQTKNLRQSYNSALLRANIQPQELKDVLMGHKRKGARKNYAFDEITIKEAYVKAFKFMCVNGIQTKRDLAELRQAQISNAKTLTKLAEENKALKEIVNLQTKLTQNMKKQLDDIYRVLPKTFGRDLTEEEEKKQDAEMKALGIEED